MRPRFDLVPDGGLADQGAPRLRQQIPKAVKGQQLPTLVTLTQGQYIFDIVGHTVMVDVKQNIAPPGPAIPTGNLKQFFEPQSDKANYAKNELQQDVQYIWSK